MTRAAFRLSLPVLCLALLAGCGSSPPVRYHALARPDADSAPVSGGARLLVEILPIATPEGLARSNMVFSDGRGQVAVMESERWAAPIADDLRQIVADRLWRAARAVDSYQAPARSASLPEHRLAIRLERFDAVPGQNATVAGAWTLRRLPNGKAHVCRWESRRPVAGPDAAAVADALADLSRRLADRIGDSLLRAATGADDACA